MERFDSEALRLRLPDLTDKLKRRQSFQGFQAFREVVGCQKGLDVLVKFLHSRIEVTMNSSLFECTVHTLNLPIRPWVIGFGQAMLKVTGLTGAMIEEWKGVCVMVERRSVSVVIC